jgi:hypothetical protein
MVRPKEDVTPPWPKAIDGPKDVLINRTKLLQAADAIEAHLKVLRKASAEVASLAGNAPTIGQWDVATELTGGLNDAHAQMAACFEAYIVAYELTVQKLRESAHLTKQTEDRNADEVDDIDAPTTWASGKPWVK